MQIHLQPPCRCACEAKPRCERGTSQYRLSRATRFRANRGARHFCWGQAEAQAKTSAKKAGRVRDLFGPFAAGARVGRQVSPPATLGNQCGSDGKSMQRPDKWRPPASHAYFLRTFGAHLWLLPTHRFPMGFAVVNTVGAVRGTVVQSSASRLADWRAPSHAYTWPARQRSLRRTRVLAANNEDAKRSQLASTRRTRKEAKPEQVA